MNIADFKENLFALNDIIFFDQSEYLREKTSNPLKILQVISDAEALLKDSNEDDKYFLYGTLGNLYRIIEQPKKAIQSLSYCLNRSVEERNLSREIVSLIRLGEALKYDSNHIEALDKFNVALNLCKANKIDKYLDFVLQHKGKCLMELAILNEAEECFLEALALRKTKGNFSLIDSTQQALNLLKELKQHRASIDNSDI
ncbi:hypothetical protein M3649_21950 [Ureibacillus chungkukjangi]|uniref:hypothetical protein n=1 Tax=Ureibacillus chungkukjangi TaxID=1202712 RepID=UPI00203D30B1|nr:hypothetical protein [Ureibacillus chungkukjangi]MCM3390743.1 hypothetical protein [Ureibacillus chungkukjangi]